MICVEERRATAIGIEEAQATGECLRIVGIDVRTLERRNAAGVCCMAIVVRWPSVRHRRKRSAIRSGCRSWPCERVVLPVARIVPMLSDEGPCPDAHGTDKQDLLAVVQRLDPLVDARRDVHIKMHCGFALYREPGFARRSEPPETMCSLA